MRSRTIFGFGLVLGLLLGFGCARPEPAGGRDLAIRPVEAPSRLNEAPEIPASRFPITWRIGDIDPRFEVTESEFRDAIERATRLWEDAAGRQLFAVDEVGGMRINLVYDERQVKVLARRKAQSKLDDLKSNLAEAAQAAKDHLKKRNDAVESINAAGEAYQSRLRAYNERVATWNERGGAPDDVVASIRSESDELKRMSDQIDLARGELDGLDRDLERAKATALELRKQFNAAVSTYNLSYAGKMDTAGEFSKSMLGNQRLLSRSINVYEVESLDDLAVVLAHEFGHALDIGHVAGSGAMMSESYSGKPGVPAPLKLTARDLAALKKSLAQ